MYRAIMHGAIASGLVFFNLSYAGLSFDQALFAGYGPQYRAWGARTDVPGTW